ncbi:MAG: PilZ domain-containing protein [Planctomycetota bacterium]
MDGPRLAMTITDERRRAPRLPTNGSAVVSALTDQSPVLTRVEMCDSSASGLGLLSPVELQPGTPLAIYPHSTPVATVFAEVVRCESRDAGYHIGLKRRMVRAA